MCRHSIYDCNGFPENKVPRSHVSSIDAIFVPNTTSFGTNIACVRHCGLVVIRLPLGTEQVVSSIPGSVGYNIPMFIEPTKYYGSFGYLIRYIWLDTKIVLKKELELKIYYIPEAESFQLSNKPYLIMDSAREIYESLVALYL